MGNIDVYYTTDSLLHRLDPRTKIIFCFTLVFTMVLSSLSYRFVGYLALVGSLVLLSNVPFTMILKRSLVVVPFAVVIGMFLPFLPRPGLAPEDYITYGFLKMHWTGIMLFANIAVKAWLSVLTMIVLTATTKFPELLKGFEKMHVSRIMILIISFMYRYIFVFLEQIYNTKKSMISRNFGGKRSWQWKMLASLIASVFIRTYEQSERIYVAMLSRGFNGDMPIWNEMKMEKRDYIFLSIGIVLLTVSTIWGRI